MELSCLLKIAYGIPARKKLSMATSTDQVCLVNMAESWGLMLSGIFMYSTLTVSKEYFSSSHYLDRNKWSCWSPEAPKSGNAQRKLLFTSILQHHI